ncbi:nucleotidyltransferase domain-containing protein [Hymenobacter sp. DH14]|uniref:Nucleotidyltransferase domain-containing protein n=1 Tax=Hymenobacter cyanobacteriorum TaxID=2926463 RepID=A0A9X1VHL5_9BACT|nr:nucleotidyltransferase domain-containing protein [Hymenobacter cyanobacteriorum]MCI1189334.1 nucleotidyltransferase domain-containing protein [Hymenobacter cyanobacteriorum]
MLDLNPRYVAMLNELIAWHLPAEVAVWAYGSRVNGNAHEGSDLDLVLRAPGLMPLPDRLLARFREALTDSNLPIFVDAHDWATLPASFHPRILDRYEVVRPGAPAPTVPA